MSFPRRVAGLSLRDRLRTVDIRDMYRIEPLLFCADRSQLVQASCQDAPWTSPQGDVSGTPILEESPGQTKDLLENYISQLAWVHLGVPLEELVEVDGERSIWISLLRLLPP